MHLPTALISAQVGTYDDDGNGTIEGSEFCRHFVKLRVRERRRRRDRHAQELEDRRRRGDKLSEECQRKFNAAERVTDVVFPEEVKRRSAPSHEKQAPREKAGPSRSRGRDATSGPCRTRGAARRAGARRGSSWPSTPKKNSPCPRDHS